jgi:hypothetical protein
MKWEKSVTTDQQESYELWHKEQKLLILDFHPFTNSARIQCAGEKRVFLIRKEGFLRNKTVLRDEYGMRIGQMGPDRNSKTEGSIDLDNEKFFYVVRNNPEPQLVIYKESIEKPFVVCGIRSDEAGTTVEFTKGSGLKTSEHFLLMSLCWYMFLPVAKEHTLEYES